MLTPWLEISDLSDFLTTLSDASGLDLRTHGTTSDAEVIRDTEIAQPLIVAASLLAMRALQAQAGNAITANVVAGHSVGELSAYALAGILDPCQAIALVARRGAAMAAAARQTNGAMSAILGGDPTEVADRLTELGLVAANRNGAGQTVAAGDKAALTDLAANPPTRARVIPLAVAGAFHTKDMASAQEVFASSAALVAGAKIPASPIVLTNRDGRIVSADENPLDLLINQITHPVRWDLCQNTMSELHVTGVLELAPAGVLTGLAKRTMPGVATFALKSPDDLTAAVEFVSEHGTPAA